MRKFKQTAFVLLCGLALSCTATGRAPDPTHVDMAHAVADMTSMMMSGDMSSPSHQPAPTDDMAIPTGGVCSNGACLTVYAHTDTGLYTVDLTAKTLTYVGPFNMPNVTTTDDGKTYTDPDIATDLAVTPSGTVYIVSATAALYTANTSTGQVTLLGQVGGASGCGTEVVALTFTPDGSLYGGDYNGTFCKIDITKSPPVATTVGKLSNNFALSGDIVAVDDGTMYGTATVIVPSSSPNPSVDNNWLIKIDPTNATATAIGQTGYGKLYGLGYAEGQVFGFTHNCSGDVVTIDPKTGIGTPFNAFPDTLNTCAEKGNTGTGVSFAGAGVNATVNPSPGPVT
jgi:hypothetical protein